jgi:hypothetical protein
LFTYFEILSASMNFWLWRAREDCEAEFGHDGGGLIEVAVDADAGMGLQAKVWREGDGVAERHLHFF